MQQADGDPRDFLWLLATAAVLVATILGLSYILPQSPVWPRALCLGLAVPLVLRIMLRLSGREMRTW